MDTALSLWASSCVRLFIYCYEKNIISYSFDVLFVPVFECAICTVVQLWF